MKRGLLILLLFSGILCHAQSDDPFNEKHRLFDGSIIFGGNITAVDGDTYDGYHKVGIEAGGAVYLHIGEVFGVSMELLYSQKGSRGGNVKESPALGTYIDKYYLDLNYVEVPLLLHFKPGLIDYEAGASYARLVKSSEWVDADVPVYIDPSWNYFNNTDLEYLAGASMRLGKYLVASLRYEHSIGPIRDWDRVPFRYQQYNVNEYNNVIVIRLMYRL